MKHPDDFARMRYQVGGELQPDQTIDGNADRFAQVQQPARQHMIENALRRIPLERYGHDFGLMAGIYQRPA